MSTQRGSLALLREYESLHPAEDSPRPRASPGALSLSGGVLMEELLTRESREGDDVTKVDVKKVKGVALMRVAKADDLPSVQGCIEEYGLELNCGVRQRLRHVRAARRRSGARAHRAASRDEGVRGRERRTTGDTPCWTRRSAGKGGHVPFSHRRGGTGSRSGTFAMQRLSSIGGESWKDSALRSRGGSIRRGHRTSR